MSNAVFSFNLDVPFTEDINYSTIISESESGHEQTYQKWIKPRRIFRVVMRARDVTETAQIWRFYTARKGAFDSFLFENPTESPVTAEIIGSGDGVQTKFYLGNTVDIATGDLIVVNGSASITRSIKGSGDYLPFSTYTINESIGQITTNSPLPSGDVLKSNYNFQYRCRFKDDSMSRENFANRLWNFGVELIEVI